MNGKALIDSNIIIYWAKGLLPNTSWLQNFESVAVSVVSYMEVLGFPFSNENEKLLLETFFSQIEIIDLSPKIVEQVITIKQANRIKLPDAIIVATALVHDCSLVTRNISDFKHFTEIALVNPYE